MADKVILPGIVGLTNYRSRLNRPLYGTVPTGAHSRQYALRRQPGGRYWTPYNPSQYVPVNSNLQNAIGQYTGVNTRLKKKKKQYKKKCCKYIRGKKYCSPRFCYKKFYWY